VRLVTGRPPHARTWILAGILLAAPGPAWGQDSVARADAALAAGDWAEAGAAYRRAFDETDNATYLKKAGEAYVKMGPKGRESAIETLDLFARHARTIEEAREARRLLAEARALPEPAPEPPPPPPPPSPPPEAPPVVVTPAAPAAPPPLTEPLPDAANVALWDALYLQDGSIIRGLLVNYAPSQGYQVALPGGSTVVLPAANVLEVRKEPNPGYQRYVLPEGPAARAAVGSGFRGTAQTGVALPTGGFGDGDFVNPSFDVFGRIGWEFIWGQVGLWPAARVEFIRWSNAANAAYSFLHVGGDVRVSAHVGKVVPYLVVGLGGDLNYFDDENEDPRFFGRKAGKGLGFHVGPGLDVLLGRHAAVGFSVSYHPGFTHYRSGSGEPADVSYFGFAAGFSIYQ